MDPTVWLDGARPPPPMFSKKIWVQQTQKFGQLEPYSMPVLLAYPWMTSF